MEEHLVNDEVLLVCFIDDTTTTTMKTMTSCLVREGWETVVLEWHQY